MADDLYAECISALHAGMLPIVVQDSDYNVHLFTIQPTNYTTVVELLGPNRIVYIVRAANVLRADLDKA